MSTSRYDRRWFRQPPASAPLSQLGRRADAVVNTGSKGLIRILRGARSGMTDLFGSSTRSYLDGMYLNGRSDGDTKLGQWEIVKPPANPAAISCAFRVHRADAVYAGDLFYWGDSASTATPRCYIQIFNDIIVSVRQGQFDTLYVVTYSDAAPLTGQSSFGLRIIAGVGVELWKDGELLTPSSTTGTLPASSIYANASNFIWMGRKDDYGGFGALFGSAIWFYDIGSPAARRLSADFYNELYAPRRKVLPIASGAPTLPTLSAATYMPGSLTSTGFRPRVTAS